MKLLVTGAAGFLGTHVCSLFRDMGWDVLGIDSLTDFELKRAKFDIEKSREHNLNFLHKIGVTFWKKDCRNITAGQILDDYGRLDFIIHCAAQPAMTVALEDPKYDADNNILSIISMLQIARKLKCPIVNCSSIHVYGNAGNENLVEGDTRFISDKEFDENTPILTGELTPLHVSKYATELYVKSFSQMYGVRAANFRFTGMYGERQFGGMDHGWVANFVIRAKTNKPVTVFGTSRQVRDILYAEDAARAFYAWFSRDGSNDTFNIGGGLKNSISLKECLDYLKKEYTIAPKRQGDLWYFVCDYKKAKADFGWEPIVSNEYGLKKLCDWVEANKNILL